MVSGYHTGGVACKDYLPSLPFALDRVVVGTRAPIACADMSETVKTEDEAKFEVVGLFSMYVIP